MKRLLALILILAPLCMVAQSKLTGKVCDDKGVPLVTVAVTAYDVREEDDVISYSITDSQGSYSLAVNIPLNFVQLEYRLIGFESVEVKASDVTFPYDVRMKETSIELDEVVVSGVPVRVVGDTITYDVNAIKNENDVTVEDVIKNIPGITVDDNGHINYNGKGINKFYIEGMDLLSGRYALATKNISADDITSVSVYENHQPKKVLKNIEFSEEAALNIKLKKQSLLHPVGTVELASGYGGEWLKGGKMSMLLVHPEFQSLNTFKYSNYEGSYANEADAMYDEYDASSATEVSCVGKPELCESSAPDELFNRDDALSANSSNIIKIGDSKTLNILGGYSSDVITNESEEKTVYWTNENEDVVFNEKTNSRYKDKTGWLETKYENNGDNLYLLNNLNANGSFLNVGDNILSAYPIGQLDRMDDYHISNVTDVIIHHKHKLLRYSSVISYASTPTCTLTACKGDSMFLSQNLSGTQLKVKQNMSYGWILSKRSKLSANVDFNGVWSGLNLQRTKYTEVNSCDLSGSNLLTSLNLTYSYHYNRFNTTLSLPLCMRNLSYKGNANKMAQNRFFPLWNASIHYFFRNGIKGGLSYSHTNTVNGLTDYITEPISSSYRDENVHGTGNVVERKVHNINAMAVYSDYLNGFSGTLMLNQSWRVTNYMSVSDVSQDEIKKSYVKANNTSSIFTGNLSLAERFVPIGLSFSLNAGVSVSSNKINRQSIVSDIRNVMTDIDFGVKQVMCNKRIIAELHYHFIPVWQKIKALNVSSSESNTNVTASVSCFPVKALELNVNGEYREDNPQSESTRRNCYVNAFAKYTYKKIDYILTVKNITNRRSYCSESLSAGDMIYNIYKLKPIQILLSLKFSFR